MKAKANINSENSKQSDPETLTALQKCVKTIKQTTYAARDKATEIAARSKTESRERRLKKYNPLFPEEYTNPEFHCPNMIIIVDDAVRRGIDVCEGAIGWRENSKGLEVLYLYDEAVANSGITFVPAATCDTAYYVDNFDRKRFIRVDQIFGIAFEERIAELKYIAYSLGAKRCFIKICESSSFSNTDNSSVAMQSEQAKASTTKQSAQTGHSQQEGWIEGQFGGSNSPQRPKLKWFSNNDVIVNLIEMRCNGQNKFKSEEYVLSGSSSSTISVQTAYAIDCTLNSGKYKGATSMKKQALTEQRRKFHFRIEF